MKEISIQEYRSIHQWIKYYYGKANKCDNQNCPKTITEVNYTENGLPFIKKIPYKKFDWALLHGKNYERNIDNFIKLCKRCHLAYDKCGEIMDLKPTKATHKYIAIRASKTIQKYLDELCEHHDEYKSKLITRLIIEAHSKLKEEK